MKKIRDNRATKSKKTIYLTASIFLGILISIILHAALEIAYINIKLGRGEDFIFYGACSLHLGIQITIFTSGVIFGYLFGRYWWKRIYVEKVFER